jgi:general secretion pathway protein I
LLRLPTVRAEPTATSGFTLIEVVVAMAVIAVLLASIGSLAATNARGVRAIEQDVAIAEVGRRLLGELPDRQMLAPGSYSGSTGPNRWRIDVSAFRYERDAFRPQTGQGAPMWIPMLVTITVRGASGRTHRLETIRLARRTER